MSSAGTQVDPKDPRVIALAGNGLDKMAIRANVATKKWEFVDGSGAVSIVGGGGGGFTYTVAPSDASARDKAKADVILTGTNDHLQIRDVFLAVRAQGGAQGGIVKVFGGTLFFNGSCPHPPSGVTLSGSGILWGNFTDRYPTLATEGFGGTKIKQLAAGTPAFTGTTGMLKTGETRCTGGGYEDLYFYGPGDGVALYDADNTTPSNWRDMGKVKGCLFHNWNGGFELAWDYPTFFDNYVQSCMGDGFKHTFRFPTFVACRAYDIGGSGIVIIGQNGGVISACAMGSLGFIDPQCAAFYITASSVSITGCTVNGMGQGDCVRFSNAVGCSVSGCDFNLNNDVGIATPSNAPGRAIRATNSQRICITGNTFHRSSSGGTSEAVLFDGSTQKSLLSANVITGQWSSGFTNSGTNNVTTGNNVVLG